MKPLKSKFGARNDITFKLTTFHLLVRKTQWSIVVCSIVSQHRPITAHCTATITRYVQVHSAPYRQYGMTPKINKVANKQHKARFSCNVDKGTLPY